MYENSDVMTFLVVFAIPIGGFLFWQFALVPWLRRLSTCGHTSYPGGTMDPKAWYIGPVLHGYSGKRGGNQSRGMPAHPTKSQDGWEIDLPVGDNLPLNSGPKLDYVTFRHGSLKGKKQIRMRYRLDLAPGAEALAVPQTDPYARYRAAISPYFQREGDDWSTEGKYETYRWYFTDPNNYPIYLQTGEHEIVVPLDKLWTATESSTQEGSPDKFRDAMEHACCVGFVFGGNELGRGHGMRATGPGKFSLLEFVVE